jgi:hypothetical protein
MITLQLEEKDPKIYDETIKKFSLKSRKPNLIGRTLHYICRGPRFELWSFHLFILRVKFLTTRLFNKKKSSLKTDL